MPAPSKATGAGILLLQAAGERQPPRGSHAEVSASLARASSAVPPASERMLGGLLSGSVIGRYEAWYGVYMGDTKWSN